MTLEHNYFVQYVSVQHEVEIFLFVSLCRFLTTKEKFHEFVDSEWQGSKSEKASQNDTDEEAKETCVDEPEAKKLKLDPEEKQKAWKSDNKRLRGQNKSRPHTKPTTYDEKRLCLSVIKV